MKVYTICVTNHRCDTFNLGAFRTEEKAFEALLDFLQEEYKWWFEDESVINLINGIQPTTNKYICDSVIEWAQEYNNVEYNIQLSDIN
jgi:hypothetical protein